MSLLFDTFVQKMKYNVLREVAKLAYNDELTPQRIMDISTKIIPEGKPMFRCCIYKERAIINERVSMALGGDDLVDLHAAARAYSLRRMPCGRDTGHRRLQRMPCPSLHG